MDHPTMYYGDSRSERQIKRKNKQKYKNDSDFDTCRQWLVYRQQAVTA